MAFTVIVAVGLVFRISVQSGRINDDNSNISICSSNGSSGCIARSSNISRRSGSCSVVGLSSIISNNCGRSRCNGGSSNSSRIRGNHR